MQTRLSSLIGNFFVLIALVLSSVPAQAAESQGEALFDGRTLKGWKETEFAARGEVTIENEQIILGMGMLTGVTWTNDFPKEDYEISLEATRLEGIDFFCGLTAPIGDSYISLIVGGWGGAVVGISSIDGADASENETTKYRKFEKGKWYRVRLRVTKTELTAWINDEEVAKIQRAGKKFSLRYGEIDLSRPLGIATWSTRGAIRNIRLTRLNEATALQSASPSADWRDEKRLMDMHLHINYTEPHLARAVKIMDAVGIGVGVNLSGGYTTAKSGETSPFEKNKELADRLYPGRFLHYLNLDYTDWNEPDFSQRAVQQIETGKRLGAAGLKEYKRLGLYLRDKEGKVIRIDDPKLDPVWKRCGELNLPVSIHVADPRAFWLPYDDKNERWKELKDHRSWWFGEASVYPPREELLAALDRVIARHTNTTFVCVHFANNAEDLEWVEAALDRNPNMRADLAARIPEIGRHDPEKVRRLFTKHQDRILFGTDFQVYERLTLGSGGSGEPPTDADAVEFFAKHWRWLETSDRDFAHMTPIQGDWTISAINLPADVLRKIYFDNARQLLAHALPLPQVKAHRVDADFALDGKLDEAVWQKASYVRTEQHINTAKVYPQVSTDVRVLWSDKYLYLGFRSPYTELTVFSPAELDKERIGLWEKDVVEAFIDSDATTPKHYHEFEVSPNGEKLDLALGEGAGLFDWNSGFESAVSIDESAKIWTTEWRIPLSVLSPKAPKSGEQWRINFYRHDRAHNVFMGWNPTVSRTAHTPEKFGVLLFE